MEVLQRSNAVIRSSGRSVSSPVRLWVFIETDKKSFRSYFAIRNNNIIFLPHSGRSFDFIAVTFLLFTCRCACAPSLAACEAVEARVISKNCVCVILVLPGVNRI